MIMCDLSKADSAAAVSDKKKKTLFRRISVFSAECASFLSLSFLQIKIVQNIKD